MGWFQVLPSMAWKRPSSRCFFGSAATRTTSPFSVRTSEHALVGEQQHLAGAVAAAFPVALSGVGVDAGEERAVEAVDGVLVG